MNRPKILLVNPWIHDFAAFDLWARPMGLLVLGTTLRRLGWQPYFLDCLDQDHPSMPRVKAKSNASGHFARTSIPKPAALASVPRTYSRYGVDPVLVEKDLLELPRPDAIMVTSLMTYWYPGVREIVTILRKVFPGVPVLLGGIYASLLPDHARENSGADEVLVGPGETVIAEALYRHTGFVGSAKPAQKTLDFTPALDLMRRVRFLPVLTSRGCPFRCAYCASRRMVSKFERRDPGQVVAEIEEARLRYGVKDIALYDDAFLLDSEHHALQILDAAAERLAGVRWHTPNGLHAAAIDIKVALALKKAGFETLRIGAESASDLFHEATGGKTTAADFVAAVRYLRNAGFRQDQIGAYLLVGLPGQTSSMIEDDVAFVLKAGAFPKPAEYSPIPGTVMWADAISRSRYPMAEEPLFQNCTLLPAAEPGVDWEFLQRTRRNLSFARGTTQPGLTDAEHESGDPTNGQ